MAESSFNIDEVAAQGLAGGGPAGSGIRDYMPQQHRSFFSALRYLAVSAVGRDGWPVATLLTGEPGFVHAPEPAILRIDAALDPADPAQAAFVPGQEVGVLGLDLVTRRRNRANGRLIARDPDGLTAAIRQSFGNCPQYIQRRSVMPVVRRAKPVERMIGLDAAARRLIGQADTLFVASRSRADVGEHGGADISHRGGRPGFVRLDGATLTIPDFHGNRYFNTLGNLLGEPRAALLFLDFASGDLLHLQGVAEIDWTGAAGRQVAGAERSWRFHVERVWRRRGAVPLVWSFVDQAPSTERTGVWPEVIAA